MEKLSDPGLIQYIYDTVEKTAFYQLVGLQLQSIAKGEAVFTLQTDERHTNPASLIHGGIIMAMADAAMGNAIRSLGVMGVTVDCSTAFLAAAPVGSLLEARGRVLKQGKNMIFAEAYVYSGEQLVGHCKASFFNTGPLQY